jgi:hypothetical protein
MLPFALLTFAALVFLLPAERAGNLRFQWLTKPPTVHPSPRSRADLS